MKRAPWSIVLSGALITVLTTVAIGLWFFLRHRDSTSASIQVAEAEFSQLRARLADQQPLLDMNRRELLVVPRTAHYETSLHWFHTVVFDTRGDQRIVRITVPY